MGVALTCTSSWGASRGGVDQEHQEHETAQDQPACVSQTKMLSAMYKRQQTYAPTEGPAPGGSYSPRWDAD